MGNLGLVGDSFVDGNIANQACNHDGERYPQDGVVVHVSRSKATHEDDCSNYNQNQSEILQ